VTAIADACLLGKIESGETMIAKNEFVEEEMAPVEVVTEAATFEADTELTTPVE
jgi:hypothetical protein